VLGPVVVLLAACAAPKPDVVWSAPDIATQNGLLRGANVLVACEAPDVAIRNVCQDQLAQQATARGAKPVFVPGNVAIVNTRPLDEQLLASARDANASAIVVLSIRPVATESEAPFSLSIGGFGFGRGSAVGGGISAPIGEQRVATGFAANGRVTSVVTGRLVWTASASAPPTEDLSRQLASLSASVLDSASRAGLF
jgi:hypothetical protein